MVERVKTMMMLRFATLVSIMSGAVSFASDEVSDSPPFPVAPKIEDVELHEITPSDEEVTKYSANYDFTPIGTSANEKSTSAIKANSFELQQLIALANESHPLLIRAKAEVESAKGDRVQAGLYPNPRFETNNPEYWAGRQSQVNFGFQQDIVVKGKLRLEKAAADQTVRRTLIEYDQDKKRLLTQIRSQFYQALAAQEKVKLLSEVFALISTSIEAAKKREAAGIGTTTDILLIESEQGLALAKLEHARRMLQGEYQQLAAILGQPELKIEHVVGSLDTFPTFQREEIDRYLTSQSTYVQAALTNITRSQIVLRRQEVEPYPNLRMGPAYAINTDTNRAQFWLSVVFDIPVYNLNQGNIRQARAEVSRAKAELEILKNDFLRQSAEAFNRYEAVQAQLTLLKTSVLPKTAKAKKLVEEGYLNGRFDVTRLLEINRLYIDAYAEYLDRLEQAAIVSVELAGLLERESFP